MKLSGNTVLVTGGASGIGLAFAEKFLQAGNKVIVVGRREEKLAEAKAKFPALHTRACDISKEEERIQLYEWAVSEFPDLNILVNNAGIQQRVNLQDRKDDWKYYQREIAINVEGPIHLSMLFIPHLKQQQEATILNITSGLAVQPGVWVPVYSATKAAIHSFSITMRHQLEDTNIRVVEVLPPAVNTDLGGSGVHKLGAPLDEFIESVYHEYEAGKLEIGYGGTEERLHASRDEIDKGVQNAWQNFMKGNADFFK